MSERYLQPEVHIIITQVPGVDGIASPARLTQIETDLATMLGRPVITTMDDIGNVDAASAADGDVLVYDDATDEWVAGPLQNGTIGRIKNADDSNAYDVSYLSLRNGLQFQESSPGTVFIQPIFGSTLGTVAQGNHDHPQPLPVRVTTGPSGYISGGSQPLGLLDVTLPNGIPSIIEAELYGQFRGADTGAAYYTLTIDIGGTTFTSPGGTDGFWCVQGVPDKVYWEYARKITGTGVAVPVSASVAWHSGSGFNIDRTYLKVTVRRDK